MPEPEDAPRRLNPFMPASGLVGEVQPAAEPELPAPQESAHYVALRDQVRAKDRELLQVRKEIALEKSGIDLDSGPGKLLAKTLAGSEEVPTPEALRAQARFYGIPIRGEQQVVVDEDDDA